MKQANASHVIPDPNVTVGRFRVLQKVTGRFCLYDETLPLPDRSVGGRDFKTLAEATRFAESVVATSKGAA